MKPGWKTSEFALSLVGPSIGLGGAIAAGFGVTLDTGQLSALAMSALSAALASHGYSGSRAKVKMAETDLFAYPPAPPAPPVDPPTDGLAAALAVISA